jgi:TolB-like protein/tetratricopeptide (TPR) repeat protein
MVLAFGDHRLDIKRRELRRGTELIDLEPKVFDLLAFLVQHRDRVVSKDDLLQEVWGGRIVSESTVTTRINAVRRALGDDGTAQRLVRTFTRKGIRFVGEVTEMSDPAAPTASDPPSRTPTAAPRLSIVVLPFTNLSNDPEQQYFADGITEDVTTDLSRIQNSFVISRNTAFTYRNKPVDTKQIGRELGVRYVLEGSVRRSSNKVRVSAQLIDAETDAHLWVDQFDSDISDLLTLQNEITSRIAITLNVELSRREAASPTNNPDALDYILRGRAAYWKTGLQSRDLFAETLGLYERALALDPRSVEAQSQVANMLAIRAGNGWTESPASDFRRAEELVEQALAASPRDYLAHYAKGSVLRFQGRCDQAIPEYERALESNPNWLNSSDFLAACKMMTGSMETAISLEQQAIRLGPRDPYIGNFYSRIGQAHLLLAQTDEAIIWFEKAAGAIPGYGVPHAYLASAYALKGETERASAELAEARRLAADGRYSSIARLKAAGTVGGPGYWGVPKVRALFEATYFAGLRKAGVPEE